VRPIFDFAVIKFCICGLFNAVTILVEYRKRSVDVARGDQSLTRLHELQNAHRTNGSYVFNYHPKPDRLSVKIKNALFRGSLEHIYFPFALSPSSTRRRMALS
jgi:hypothetical protein